MSDPILQLIQKLPADKRAVLAKALQPVPEPIALVGMACRFPGGVQSPDAFWQMLAEGRDGIVEVPLDRWDVNNFYDPDPQVSGKMYTRYGGFLPNMADFDAEFFGISPREALRMDPQQRLLLEVTWEALENSGVKPSIWAGTQTGVFAGILTNQYTARQMQADRIGAIDDPYFGIGTSNSVAAGRISYFFDFQGPSISVDTACSSSLVALHLACESLRRGECEQAIVGGVHVVTLPESMVNACKMQMLAADGRCKTFDAHADGFALGEGCGVVVVKKLGDARRDGNRILAIIRGSAVNEDGRSSSLTAPNGLAQQAVMRRALRQAKIDPALVSYVEAHGSGTAMGDPIEMESIQAVYGHAERPLYAATVKTNIGHLTAGAGVAGLIKTVLALQNKAIPPLLNFNTPNPNIPWADIDVQLPLEPISWQPVEGRYLAGVNSFGWSGTNAHIILEAGDDQNLMSPASLPETEEPVILPLSARSRTSLEQQAHRLAQFIEDDLVPLSQVAATLQTEREVFAQRAVIVGHDSTAIISALRDSLPVVTARTTNEVVFMLPGLGDQYAGMAHQLYQTDEDFRQMVDVCCDMIRPALDCDLRTLIYPDSHITPSASKNGTKLNFRQMVGRSGHGDQSASPPLNRTCYAQPALFIIEYALAQWWQGRGVQPDVLIGYSLGEYVAACLAGVFTLEDALKLVVKRAQLIDALPAGCMLAVASPVELVREMLPDTLSICAINGALMTVVGGDQSSIEAFAQLLQAHGHTYRLLQTTHAFHSHMMESICQDFRAYFCAQITPKAPHTPLVSNVTGTWLTDQQAMDPDYWVQHLRQPIQFVKSLQTLWKIDSPLFLEVGMGQTLTSLALQAPQRTEYGVAISSLPTAYAQHTTLAYLYKAWGELWSAGVSIIWPHGDVRTRTLPNYAWAHQTYWIDYRQAEQHRISTIPDKQPLEDWFYLPTWQRQPTVASHSMKHWLLFSDNHGVGIKWAQALGERAIVVTTGPKFLRLRDNHYSLDFADIDHYKNLIKHLCDTNQMPTVVADLRGLNDEFEIETGFQQVLYLSQALITHVPEGSPLTLCLFANQVHDVLGGEMITPDKATLLGFVRVLPKEHAHLQTRLLDLQRDNLPQFALLAADIEQDAAAPEVVAYRGNGRWIQTFSPTQLSQTVTPPLKPKGVYLVTGGLGTLGMGLTEELATQLDGGTLILVGRTPLPPRTEWDASHDDKRVQRLVQHIQMLEAKGVTVLAVTADVAIWQQLSFALDQAGLEQVDGIFHLAGVPGEGLIQFKTPEMATAVFAPKIQGTKNLVRYFPHVDFMVLYSSSNALLGGPGEVDYCASNAFLGAFAQQRSLQGYQTIALDWGAWEKDSWQSEILSAFPALVEKIGQMRQKSGISFAEGHQAMWSLLATGQPHWLILTQPIDVVRAQWESLSTKNLLAELATDHGPRFPRPNIRTAYVPPRTETEKRLALIWAEALAIEEVGLNDHFFELGGNSLIGMMIMNKIEQAFAIKLSAAALYEGPTIQTLAGLVQPDTATQTLTEHAQRGATRRSRRAQQRNQRRR